ncbi:unnamed protein product, partial [Didymodactylos carnosus]
MEEHVGPSTHNNSQLPPTASIPLPVITSIDALTSADVRAARTSMVGTTTPDINTGALAAPSTTVVVDRNKVNLESHQLVWLDANVNNSEHEDTTVTLAGLRKIIDYTKLFDNISECKEYLKSTENGSTFLVTSGSFGQTFVPEIHEVEIIYKIYVYCGNKEFHQKWASKYSKTKNRIHIKLDELLNDLTNDVREYLKSEIAGTIMNLSGKEDQTTDVFCSWWTHTFDLLCCLPYPMDCHQKLVDTLKSYYEGKENEMKVIREFEISYEPKHAIWWYTRPTFFYAILNRSLRQHNIELIFLFGFYIKDVYYQLKDEHEKLKLKHLKEPKIKLYRGQLMAMNEIKKLKEIDGPNYIVNSCLLSTSLNRSVSLEFLKSADKSEGLEHVFFEIDIDTRKLARPYGNISHLSYVTAEAEILFMIGVIFRITKGNVTYNNDDKVWIIKCSSSFDSILDFESAFSTGSQRRILKNSINKFWHNSTKMPTRKSEDVNMLFNELIKLFPLEEDWILSYKLCCLADIDMWHEKSTSALSQYDEAINIWLNYLKDDELNCSIDIGEIHKDIGTVYQIYTDDTNRAEEHYKMSFSYLQSAIERSTTEQEKIDILVKLISIVIECELYESLDKYDDALIYYEKAFEAAVKSKDSRWIEIACDNMIETYIKHKNDYQSALKYQLIRHEHILKDNTPQIWDDIDETSCKKAEIADSHIRLAESYILLDQHDLVKLHL